MQEAAPGEITHLLGLWEKGESGFAERLAPLVYERLREIAEAYLRNERIDHTLQPTAVVNEIFVDLLHLRQIGLRDREHFFTFAAKLARRILVDSARKSKSGKRGGGWQRIPLEAELAWISDEEAGCLDLSAALEELAEFDPMKTRIIEVHFFLGCSVQETAELLHISKSTVERGLRFSLAWLGNRLRPVQ